MLTWKFTSPAQVLAVNIPGRGQIRFVDGRYETDDSVTADALTQISKRSHLVNLAPLEQEPEPAAGPDLTVPRGWWRIK